MTDGFGDITGMLQAWRHGDEQALESLTPRVYRELHRSARRYMLQERQGHTLQPTALINELYLRLGDLQHIDWQSRAHFFALCARQMRRILIEEARARKSHKRGSGAHVVSLDESPEVAACSRRDLLELDEALKELAKLDERKSQVIELRFFGGLTVEETAEVLKISPESVARDWRLAKAWLTRELAGKK